jgi:hypothetical protein
MPLPINVPKRGFSKEEAAEYCGVSVGTLERHGPEPTKITKRKMVYDRRVLDRWLDELAGLAPEELSDAGLQPDTPEEKLLEAIHARQAALRRTSH